MLSEILSTVNTSSGCTSFAYTHPRFIVHMGWFSEHCNPRMLYVSGCWLWYISCTITPLPALYSVSPIQTCPAGIYPLGVDTKVVGVRQAKYSPPALVLQRPADLESGASPTLGKISLYASESIIFLTLRPKSTARSVVWETISTFLVGYFPKNQAG